ncbi:MAG: hypothetical protein GX247_02010 [Mollicutes bacterium]|nr:hypothetical protein [Mollicutes bacterium]
MNHFIAHRGNDDHPYKENTQEAILECLKKDYILGVEFDVRMTKDKKIVIAHNMTISKVSDGYGLIKNMTLKELQKYNFGTKQYPSKIVTLDSVLEKINGNKKIVIEIKAEMDRLKMMIDRITKIINKYNHLNLYLCSFNRQVMEYLYQKKIPAKLGIILVYPFNLTKIESYCDFYVINYLYFKKLEQTKEIMVWTVNSKDIYNNIKYKINENVSIITDKAYLLK